LTRAWRLIRERIPVTKLGELRRVAEERGVEPSALMRRWVLERLDQEAGRADQDPAMVPAAAVREALERLLVEHRRAS
jgi:transposase-like protein